MTTPLAPPAGRCAARSPRKYFGPRSSLTTSCRLPPDETAALRARLGIDGELVVCVGRLVPRKGQDKLIDALALLRYEFPRLHLALVGEGRLATRLYDRAQRRGVGERVRLTGALTDSAVKDWLRAADLFASPCRTRWGGFEVEGFGIVFAEAALCGLPVVAGRSGGAPEAVDEGETGPVVDGRSAQQVAAALASLLRLPPERRREMGARGRELTSRATRQPWSASVTGSCSGERSGYERARAESAGDGALGMAGERSAWGARHRCLAGRGFRRRLPAQWPAGDPGSHRRLSGRHRRRQAGLVQRRSQRGLEARRRRARPGRRQGLRAGVRGATVRRRATAPSPRSGITAMVGHIAVVKGRGAACAPRRRLRHGPGA